MRLLRNTILYTAAVLLLAFFAVHVGDQLSANGADFFKNSFFDSSYRQRLNINTADTLTSQSQDVVSKITPSVVSIYGETAVSRPDVNSQRVFLPGFNISFSLPSQPQTQSTEVSAGSGFFVDKNGYILTNRHVVPDDNSKYTVVLNDGTKKDAEVVYRDPDYDIAIVKISGNDYPALTLGDSSAIKTGQTVFSMGNAFGQFPNMVSEGKILALHKTIVASNEDTPQQLNDVIQTSAQLYPGDSGGPTFDSNGIVVGINVAMAVGRGRVSFSLPINEAQNAIANAVKNPQNN